MSRKEDRIYGEGFTRACDIAREKGLEGLFAEERFRGILATQFRTQVRLTSTELEQASEDIKTLLMSTMEVAMLSAAHDAFGFGEKRLAKLLREFDKLSSYMANGWIYWLDLVTELKKEHCIDLAIKDTAGNLLNYRRPEPEDMYTEADLISAKDWEETLQFLGMHDDGKRVSDPSGYIWWDYKDPYSKIQIYDILCGIEFAVRFLHATRPGDEMKDLKKPEPVTVEPVSVKAKPDRKKRRKR